MRSIGERQDPDSAQFGEFRGLLGAAAYQIALERYEAELAKFDTQALVDGAELARRGEVGIRIFLEATKKKGFVLERADWRGLSMEHIGFWKRFAWCKPSTALIVDHKKRGPVTFIFSKKADIVTAVSELERAFGDDFSVHVKTDIYTKAMKKYEQSRKTERGVADDF